MTLMAEREEELKSLLMKVKGEWKSWPKTQHSENEDHGTWEMVKDGETWRAAVHGVAKSQTRLSH